MPTAAYQSIVDVAQNLPFTVLTIAGARLRYVLQQPVPVALAEVIKNKLVRTKDIGLVIVVLIISC